MMSNLVDKTLAMINHTEIVAYHEVCHASVEGFSDVLNNQLALMGGSIGYHYCVVKDGQDRPI